MTEGAGRGVTVVGHGSATAVPDVAIVRVATEFEDPDAATAATGASAAMRAVVAAARAAGVAAADLRTLGMSQYLRGEDEHHGPRFVGRQALQVRFHDVGRAGELVRALLVAGGPAARLEAVELGVDDERAVADVARDRAMADALHRAERLADRAGRRLGEVLSVAEGVGGSPRPLGGIRHLAAAATPAAPPVEPGSLDVDVTVEVRFAWAD